MNWKALLKQLKLEHIKATAPSFFDQSGGYGMQVKPYKDTTSNGLTTCIVDFINFIGGGEASRISSTGMPRVVNGKVRWTTGNTRKGMADVRGTYAGRSLSVEIKIGEDRQSEAQIKEQQRIEKAGGLYCIAKTFTGFLEWFICRFPDLEEKIKMYSDTTCKSL